MDAYLCPVCTGAVTDTQWQCRDCHAQLESSDIERMQEVCKIYHNAPSPVCVNGSFRENIIIVDSRIRYDLHCRA